MTSERGFTLIETLIAVGIGVLVIVALVIFVARMSSASAALDVKAVNMTAANHVFERMTADAASSWAAYVPQNDALGNSNSDGHEVDFYSEDGSHRSYTWAYLYDATSRHITRYSRLNGTASVADEDLGAFDSFAATSVAASGLGSADPLFAASTIPAISYGYDSNAEAAGGNGLVRIAIAANGVNRSEMLASSTVPTTFTVVVNYTPSPAPVATATPTPMAVSPGATFTPTPTPTIAITPTPTPTLSPTPSPTPTGCAVGCGGGSTTAQTFKVRYEAKVTHGGTEWTYSVSDVSSGTSVCFFGDSLVNGEYTNQCPFLWVFNTPENLVTFTSASEPTVSPGGYTWSTENGLQVLPTAQPWLAKFNVGIGFVQIGPTTWVEQLAGTGPHQLPAGNNGLTLDMPFTVTTY